MRPLVATASILLCVALSSCGGGGATSTPDEAPSDEPTTTALEDASAVCADEEVGNPLDPDNSKPASTYITVEDEGQTLLVQGGDQFSTPAVGFCVLDALDAPASTTSKIEGTTAMMGRQTDEFDGYEITWSYHPDTGLDMIIEGAP